MLYLLVATLAARGGGIFLSGTIDPMSKIRYGN